MAAKAPRARPDTAGCDVVSVLDIDRPPRRKTRPTIIALAGRPNRVRRLLEQVFAHELDRGVKLEVGVLLLREAVAFVLAHKIPDRGVLFL